MNKEKIKEVLLQQRAELVERVTKTSKHLYQRDKPVSSIFSEQSVEMHSTELIYQLDGEGKEEIRQIDRALHRLEQGKYGICAHCGEEIAKKRLKALPYTDKCIDCASMKV